MVANDDAMARLVEVLEKDAHVRAEQLVDLNQKLEDRNRLLEQQLNKKTSAGKWYGLLAILLIIGMAIWLYLISVQVKTSVDGMSTSIGTIKSFLKGSGAVQSSDAQAGYMKRIAQNTESMSEDMEVTREAMLSASANIAGMRQAMNEMRTNTLSMNNTMSNLGGDMKHVNKNIAAMARSVSHMNQSVQRMSSDSEYMPGPFRGVMPWK